MDTDIASQSAADFKATKRKRMSDVAMGEGPDEDGDLMLDNAAPPSSEERAVKVRVCCVMISWPSERHSQ
jgi:hypothetical protein